MKNFNMKYANRISGWISTIDLFDKKFSDVIHSLEFHHTIEKIIYYFGRLFNPDFITSYLILILLYKVFFERDYLFVFKPLMHTLISLILTIFIKRATARPRPIEKSSISRFYNLRKHEKNFSMPSGDSLQSANFAIIIYLYFNSFLGFFLIPGVMFARIYFFCHYLLDTIIGTIMGLLISYNLYLLLN